jgi:elongation factor 1-gamma
MRSFSIGLNQFKKNLAPFEKHLKLRNFLVGHSLTLADVTLLVNLITPLQTVLDLQFRKDSLPNLSRYASLILEGRAFKQTFGKVHFNKKMIQPQFPAKVEQKPAKEAAPVKAAPASKKEEVPAQEKIKEQTWEDKLPEFKNGFGLFDFKTLIVNHADKKEAL